MKHQRIDTLKPTYHTPQKRTREYRTTDRKPSPPKPYRQPREYQPSYAQMVKSHKSPERLIKENKHTHRDRQRKDSTIEYNRGTQIPKKYVPRNESPTHLSSNRSNYLERPSRGEDFQTSYMRDRHKENIFPLKSPGKRQRSPEDGGIEEELTQKRKEIQTLTLTKNDGIFNLTHRTLTQPQHSLLEKGLKFAPSK
ncbi:Hypothetical predicted protein, partial [Pelobates cultripes]